jgi:hypothetical protein
VLVLRNELVLTFRFAKRAPISNLNPPKETGIGRPSASNPRGYSRYISGNFFASSFGFSMIRFQPLLACSHAAIFIGLSESFSTLLIASFLCWISFAFFFHNIQA